MVKRGTASGEETDAKKLKLVAADLKADLKAAAKPAAKPAAKAAAAKGPEEPAAAAEVVPAGRVSGGGGAASSGPAIDGSGRPKVPLPSAAPAGACARQYMRSICPWVLRELPRFMQAHSDTGNAEMHARQPLTICQGPLSSFKEPWDPRHCEESLFRTGLYEAGGNVAWIDPEVAAEEASDDPSWAWVWEYAVTGFEAVAYGEGTDCRIRFPIGLETYWEHYQPNADFPVGLKLLTAHGHLWSWYVAVFRGLGDGEVKRVLALYECALTATVTTRIDVRKEALARDALLYSERVREDAKTLVINFVTFADKLQLITGGRHDLQALQKMKLRFCGGLVNATMLKVANSVCTVMDKRCRTLLSEIDRRFGREVLSGSYNKVRLLIQGCQNKASDHGVLVSWCLETMLVMLSRRDCAPADFTVAQFSKGRDGTPSWVAQAIATRAVVMHMQSILDNISHVDEPLASNIRTQVFDKMSSPMLYDQCFPKDAACDAPSDAEEGSGVAVDTETPGEAFMEDLRTRLPKAGVMFAETLRKLFDNTYDADITNLAKESDPLAKLSADGADLGDLTRDLNDMMRAIHIAEAVVGTGSDTGPPKASLRELVRHNSAPEDREAAETERTDVWRRAQAQRKKLVTLGLVKDAKNKNSYAEVFRRATASRSFRGEANEQHRAFVLSADLLAQSGTEPWLQASVPADDVVTAAVEFITAQRDTFDVALAFDGTMRRVRRQLEDQFLAMPGAAEFAIVYDRAPNSIFQRRNFMSHRNIEMGYVKMPISRTKVAVKDRADGFGASGETSSTFTSYSGVKGIPRTALAMISPADKEKIFAERTGPVPRRWVSRSSGVPLFWLETKSQEFWAQLCEELSIKCIVDLSPGSGLLAQSCMAAGVQYFGVCATSQHLHWLSNVLDRAALKYIVESGTFLYQEELATHIQELFADVLQSLDVPEEDEEAVQASDEEAA